MKTRKHENKKITFLLALQLKRANGLLFHSYTREQENYNPQRYPKNPKSASLELDNTLFFFYMAITEPLLA